MNNYNFIRKLGCMLVLFSAVQCCCGQGIIKELPLYDGAIPGAKATTVKEQKGFDPEVDSLVYHVSVPTLEVFRPAYLPPGAPAVIICPGGGYHTLLINREGRSVAEAFNRKGIAAFVLKYRLPDDAYLTNKAMAPLMDAQQAILKVKQHAAKWGIDPHAIGIMGFSAGGHVAAMAGTHFDSVYVPHSGGISPRPDFMILINPVISFSDGTGHGGSRSNLLGAGITEDKIRFFSGEQQVTERTPPAFLAHAADDKVVPLANSMDLFAALKKNRVAAELHVYAFGDHGFLKNLPAFEQWFGSCIYWMQTSGWLKQAR
ncbi:alpha/beta hydrolase [Niabella beijingensis]|uniref:alpha/beta hydrolase n=1 Tax=Niabella beijingensis TaxID=2872700 RepID=UPI001CBAF16D|nr:alpha/beta hydrolase [Niabella beijingensis]MBZ4190534.1 alpha/beta hydrolase [Niabella beijingensis]